MHEVCVRSFHTLSNYTHSFICRNPISIECLGPFGGPIEPGISVGGYPKDEEGTYKIIL